MGLALSADRMSCIVAFGRAAFVVGPSERHEPGGIDVDPHAWVMIEGNGVLDVSPTFDQCQLPVLRAWGQTVIERNKCIPGERFIVAETEDAYEQAVSVASNLSMQRSAIYFGRRFDYVNADAIERARLIASSPLTGLIISQYSEKVLFAAARHLFDLAYGRAEPLSGKSQERAWGTLAKRKRDDREWLISRLASDERDDSSSSTTKPSN